MNTFLLLTAMTIGADHHLEDFHYYNESVQSSGLPLVNKIYINLSSKEDKRNFLVFASSNLKNMTEFKEIKSEGLDGLLLTFKDKKDIVDALNVCTDYPAYPVVIFDGIECTHTNEIIVGVQPSVNKEDFLKRLQKVSNGTFKIDEVNPKVFLVQIEGLRNPSNALILANLIAKDNFWARYARVSWIPLDGYVKAFVSVETPAASNLGQRRNFKIVIHVADPDIKIKTDLLPQMGQTLVPMTFAGEDWIDVFPVEIQEINLERSKKIIVTYPFRYLRFGSFTFKPVTISYEKNGQLITFKTDSCNYFTSSLISDTFVDISDLQELPTDKLDLPIVKPLELPQLFDYLNYSDKYKRMKIGVGSVCFGFGTLFLVATILSFKRKLFGWFTKIDESETWNILKHTIHHQNLGKNNYLIISNKLNNIMNEIFGVSLYSVDIKNCNTNFRNLVQELNKVYEPDAVLDSAALRKFIMIFCKERNYL